MPTVIMLLLMLASIARGDVAADEYVLPVRIHFAKQPPKMAWVAHDPRHFSEHNPEQGAFRRPLPGRQVLFMNKLGRGDSLVYSEKVYAFPDSVRYLVAKTLAFQDILLIEDISSDSLPTFGFYGNHWLSPAAGKVLAAKQPLFTDRIGEEGEDTYRAEHVYNFDPALTKEKIRQLYRQGGRSNPTLKRALADNRIILMRVSSP